MWLALNSCIVSSIIKSRSNSVYWHKKVEEIFKRQAWKLSVKWRISFHQTRSERTKRRRQNIRMEPPLLRSLQTPSSSWTSRFEHYHDSQPRTPTSLQWRPIKTFFLVCILFCYFFPLELHYYHQVVESHVSVLLYAERFRDLTAGNGEGFPYKYETQGHFYPWYWSRIFLLSVGNHRKTVRGYSPQNDGQKDALLVEFINRIY